MLTSSLSLRLEWWGPHAHLARHPPAKFQSHPTSFLSSFQARVFSRQEAKALNLGLFFHANEEYSRPLPTPFPGLLVLAPWRALTAPCKEGRGVLHYSGLFSKSPNDEAGQGTRGPGWLSSLEEAQKFFSSLELCLMNNAWRDLTPQDSSQVGSWKRIGRGSGSLVLAAHHHESSLATVFHPLPPQRGQDVG